MHKLLRPLRLAFLASAVALSLLSSVPKAQANSVVCYESDPCYYCCDLISDCCSMACPWGDSFWC